MTKPKRWVVNLGFKVYVLLFFARNDNEVLL
uniref:Uncharacterized protein n=1 Tax=Glycine max TaxID=3847 RepID=A0A0R0KDL3_SOYBN